jgi:orotidine-5'-phosphate decarboxylase
MNKPKGQLIVALDVDTFEEARGLVDSLSPVVDIFKVGSQLFTACGPVIVRYIHAHNKKVFLDLKYHDIPNTVANAIKSAVGLGVPVHDVVDGERKKLTEIQHLFMCTVHIIGGEEMMSQAVAAATKVAQNTGVTKPLIVGITILTSEAKTDNIGDIVLQRARLAKKSGLDGVVASSQETALIRREFGDDFIIVTPGIRPAGMDAGDQKRVATPREAVTNGSHYIVIGRPIVKAEVPLHAAEKILQEMKQP